MTDDKTMTAVADIRSVALWLDNQGEGILEAAADTLSATLQARDSEVAKEREYAADAAARVLKAELAQRKAEAECARLRSALAHIVAVLGPNVPASVTSSGARYEWADALGTAEDALNPHVEPVGINAGGDAEGGEA